MMADQVAGAALRALESGQDERTMTRDGKPLLLINRLAPRLEDSSFRRRPLHPYPILPSTTPAPSHVAPPPAPLPGRADGPRIRRSRFEPRPPGD
ncbi:MAG: hypothetical protein ACM35G_06725 [Planctomycetaceae bacterium]